MKKRTSITTACLVGIVVASASAEQRVLVSSPGSDKVITISQ